MKKLAPLFGILLLLLTACGRQSSPQTDSSHLQEENTARLQEELSRVLASQETSDYDFSPKGFTTSAGAPFHQFSGRETVAFKSRVSFEGQYLLLFTATGDENAQIQISSDTLGFEDQLVPITADGDYGFLTTAELVPGEYTFTAETQGDEGCDLMAFICPLQKLETLPDTLSGDLPAAYLCTFSENTDINYTFYDERDFQKTYGPMAEFYKAGDAAWHETVYMENKTREAAGSVNFPAGDFILYFHTSNWHITFG